MDTLQADADRVAHLLLGRVVVRALQVLGDPLTLVLGRNALDV